MLFYLPDSRDKHDLKLLIERNGGMVTAIHECFTYQIAPISEDVPKIEFFQGAVYRGHWIIDSIKAGRLLNVDDYFAFTNTDENGNIKKYGFEQGKVKYTITEAIKVFEIALANQHEEHKSTGQ